MISIDLIQMSSSRPFWERHTLRFMTKDLHSVIKEEKINSHKILLLSRLFLIVHDDFETYVRNSTPFKNTENIDINKIYQSKGPFGIIPCNLNPTGLSNTTAPALKFSCSQSPLPSRNRGYQDGHNHGQ
jgi:hypothetical protein